MTSLLALAVLEVRRQVKVADLIGALTTEALLGTDTPFKRGSMSSGPTRVSVRAQRISGT